MGKSWNPNAPAVLGPEPTPTGGADSGIQAYIVRDLIMDSTQAETATALKWAINDNGAFNNNRPGTWMEVYEDGEQDINDAPSTSYFQPNADAAGSQIGAADWNSQPGSGTTNLWSFIDETPVVWPQAGAPGDRIATASGPDIYNFHINSAAFSLSQRVDRLYIHLIVLAEDLGIGQYSNRNFACGIRRQSDGLVMYPLQGAQFWGTAYTTDILIDCGEVNPFTGLPWLPQFVRDLSNLYSIRIEGVGTGGTWAAVCAAEVIVKHRVERRVAAGVWVRPDGQLPGYVQTVSLITLPGGAANWSKANAERYCYRWRIPNDFFVANPTSWPTTAWRTALTRVDPSVVEGLPHNTVARVTQLDSFGNTIASFDSDAVPQLLLVVAGNASSDSQPYYLNPVDQVAQASGSLQQMQRVTPAANASYLGVKFIVRPTSQPSGTLTVTVHRVSDGVQMGGSLVLTQPQILALPAIEASPTYYQIQGFLSSAAALVAGTQYEIRLTPNTGTWQFPRMIAPTEGDITFGGTSNCRAERTNPGGVVTTFPDEDLGIVLLQEPPAMSAASAQVELTPIQQGVSCFCRVDGIENVIVRWTGAVVPSFSHIEVERLLDTGDYIQSVWKPVMRRLSNPSQVDSVWVDREVPRGTPAKYRLRNVDLFGAWSQWKETDFVTPHARGCELIFTSNEDPGLTLVYEHEPQVGYDIRGFDEDNIIPIDGADYQIVFVGSEDRGIWERRRIIVNFGHQPCDDIGRPIGKRRLFKPIRDAARWQNVPYICVLDSDGNRMFGHVALDNAESEEPGWRYYVESTMIPVTDDPVVVEIP